MAIASLVSLVFLIAGCVYGGHYYNADGTPHDPYHDLHLPHYPPLYPEYPGSSVSARAAFSCEGREWGYHADESTGCQVFHLCQDHVVSSHVCTNGTLFHPQFKVCDNFYNVRCGVPLEDL